MWNPFNNKEDQAAPLEVLTPKQERLTALVTQLSELLPPMARAMIPGNILSGLSHRFDDEQIDAMLLKFREVIDYVEYGGDQPLDFDLTDDPDYGEGGASALVH